MRARRPSAWNWRTLCLRYRRRTDRSRRRSAGPHRGVGRVRGHGARSRGDLRPAIGRTGDDTLVARRPHCHHRLDQHHRSRRRRLASQPGRPRRPAIGRRRRRSGPGGVDHHRYADAPRTLSSSSSNRRSRLASRLSSKTVTASSAARNHHPVRQQRRRRPLSPLGRCGSRPRILTIALRWLIHRSTALRCWYASASKSGARPPLRQRRQRCLTRSPDVGPEAMPAQMARAESRSPLSSRARTSLSRCRTPRPAASVTGRRPRRGPGARRR